MIFFSFATIKKNAAAHIGKEGRGSEAIQFYNRIFYLNKKTGSNKPYLIQKKFLREKKLKPCQQRHNRMK